MKTFVLTTTHEFSTYFFDQKQGMWKRNDRRAMLYLGESAFLACNDQPHQNWDLDRKMAKRKMIRSFSFWPTGSERVREADLDWNEVRPRVRIATPRECQAYVDHVVSDEIHSLW